MEHLLRVAALAPARSAVAAQTSCRQLEKSTDLSVLKVSVTKTQNKTKHPNCLTDQMLPHTFFWFCSKNVAETILIILIQISSCNIYHCFRDKLLEFNFPKDSVFIFTASMVITQDRNISNYYKVLFKYCCLSRLLPHANFSILTGFN